MRTKTQGRTVIAIPARNEAERIGACLQALSNQDHAEPPHIVVLVNNTHDATTGVISRLRPALRCSVEVVERNFAPSNRSAGFARRVAMNLAAQRAGADGVLLTTDADGRAAPDWLARNLYHLRHGIDAVAGMAEIDVQEAKLIPAALHRADAQECAYAAVLDQIDSLINPNTDDPWPRHTHHAGASIAVTASTWARAGGMPAVALGEDRAFFAALRRIDARIRHAPEVRVTVSGRLFGRAAGGMADTMRRRIDRPDPFLDDALEPAAAAVRRSQLRAATRRLHAAHDLAGLRRHMLALECPADTPLAGGFGAVWAAIEHHAPSLARHPVPLAELPAEMARAEALRDALLQQRIPDTAIAA